MKKYIINKFGDNFWYYPSILVFSKRKWAARSFKDIFKLLKVVGIKDDNFVISLNNDRDLKIFRMMQAKHEIKIFLNKEQVKIIEEEGYIDYKLPRIKTILRYDKKSLLLLRKGFTPYCSREYLRENFKNQTIVWRRNGWVVLK